MLYRYFGILALGSILAGCVTQPPIRLSESVESKPIVGRLIIPPPELYGGAVPNGPGDLASRIRFKNVRNVGKGDFPEVEVMQWRTQGSSFVVENYKAFYAPNVREDLDKVSVSFEGTLRLDKPNDNYQLVFTVENRKYYDQRTMGYKVNFAPSDATVSLLQAEIQWKVEVDSEFNAESTYANFVRLTRKEVFGGNGEKNLQAGKIFKERFWVRVAGREIPINVETYPYRNGSKAVVYATLSGAISGNDLDFVGSANALKKEIERIVKS